MLPRGFIIVVNFVPTVLQMAYTTLFGQFAAFLMARTGTPLHWCATLYTAYLDDCVV